MSKKAINDKSLKKILKNKSLSLSMMREKAKQNKVNKARHVDEMADRLVRIYKAEGSRQFFLKCCWYIEENRIEEIIQKSKRPKIKVPLKYFVSSCHNEMLKIGV